MNEDQIVAEVEGAQQLVKWLGCWPSFHDAEVVSLNLNRVGQSNLNIHTFNMTGELDATSHYVCAKHVVVTFAMTDVYLLELRDFNHQNVLSGLRLEKSDEGYLITLGGCYGLEGRLGAKQVQIAITPGFPPSSIYSAGVTRGF